MKKYLLLSAALSIPQILLSHEATAYEYGVENAYPEQNTYDVAYTGQLGVSQHIANLTPEELAKFKTKFVFELQQRHHKNSVTEAELIQLVGTNNAETLKNGNLTPTAAQQIGEVAITNYKKGAITGNAKNVFIDVASGALPLTVTPTSKGNY